MANGNGKKNLGTSTSGPVQKYIGDKAKAIVKKKMDSGSQDKVYEVPPGQDMTQRMREIRKMEQDYLKKRKAAPKKNGSKKKAKLAPYGIGADMSQSVNV